MTPAFFLPFSAKLIRLLISLASQLWKYGATGFGTYGRIGLIDCFYNFQLSEFFIVPLEKVSRAYFIAFALNISCKPDASLIPPSSPGSWSIYKPIFTKIFLLVSLTLLYRKKSIIFSSLLSYFFWLHKNATLIQRACLDLMVRILIQNQLLLEVLINSNTS